MFACLSCSIAYSLWTSSIRACRTSSCTFRTLCCHWGSSFSYPISCQEEDSRRIWRYEIFPSSQRWARRPLVVCRRGWWQYLLIHRNTYYRKMRHEVTFFLFLKTWLFGFFVETFARIYIPIVCKRGHFFIPSVFESVKRILLGFSRKKT